MLVVTANLADECSIEIESVIGGRIRLTISAGKESMQAQAEQQRAARLKAMWPDPPMTLLGSICDQQVREGADEE